MAAVELKSAITLPVFDVPDGGARNAIDGRDSTGLFSYSKALPNIRDLGGGKWHLYQSRSYSVVHVFNRGQILQIAKAIISLLAVLAIHLVSVWRRAQKGGCDYPVDQLFPTFTIPTESNRPIAVSFLSLDKDAARALLNATETGNRVNALITKAIAPFFGFKLFSGKFWSSQGVNLHRQGLALVRPVRLYQQSFGPVCILA